MIRVPLASPIDFDGWRGAARALAAADVPASDIAWSVRGGEADLFGADGDTFDAAAVAASPGFAVPRGFIELAQTAILNSDPERFALLYRMLLRLKRQHDALQDTVDPLAVRLQDMAKSVRRDIHKMHAFVRFRVVPGSDPEWFVAWFEPEHHIVSAAAPFFQRRFASMRWSILTPESCVHWDGESLRFTDGVERSAAPREDALEDLWRSYYASIFNPARLKIGAMQAEMPKKYWRNLPEAELIAPLIREAGQRSSDMVQNSATEANARPQRPARSPQMASPAISETDPASLAAVRHAAADCRRCPLYADATQTVFGEGPENAEIVFVGEQAGDQEDLVGKPFVGPAGQLLDRALVEAGIDRRTVYVTNAVKHFKFLPRGKRRIHQKPSMGEIQACRWWLTQELSILRPKLVVALGVTALVSLTGKATSLRSVRGQTLSTDGDAPLIATVHPSFLLRLPDADAKAREYAGFLADLRTVAKLSLAA